MICLALVLVVLAGCRGKEAPVPSSGAEGENSSAVTAPSEDGAASSSEAPARERWEGPVPGGEFPLLEYHAGEDGQPDSCAVELPLLKSCPIEGWEDLDLTPANAPLEQLRREWESFRESPEHQGGAWWEVRSYPYSNGEWMQVVVHKAVYPTYADDGSILSANFDRQTGRVVTAGEAMGRFSLTPEGMRDSINGQDPAALAQLPGARVTAREVTVTAFRGRGDGTAVFYARVLFEVAGNEDYNGLIAYDTREGGFAPFRQKLDQGEEQPNGIRIRNGQEDFPPARPEYRFEPVPAPAAEVRVVLPLREYHNHNMNCYAELPRLTGAEGLEAANAPLEQLEREWREYRSSTEHEAAVDDTYPHGIVVRSYPYSNARWAQVVVTSRRRTDTGEDVSFRVTTANYDLEQKRVVAPEEVLEQKGLTADGLLERLKRENITRVLQTVPYNTYTPRGLTVAGFRGREDGSAVFYLAADCHYRFVRSDNVEPYEWEYDIILPLAYDTRDDTFRGAARDLLRKWEGPELPNSFTPPLVWEEEMQNPMI